MIIWLNGGFGAGKTTLAEELHRRLPDAVVYDPRDVSLTEAGEGASGAPVRELGGEV